MLLLLRIIGLKSLISSVWNMLLVFRSMLPPSHWQNKALQVAAWLLFFTNSHANASWSSAFSGMHGVYKLQCTQCAEKYTYRNTHNIHTEHILFCSPSSQSAEQLQTHTLFPSYSSSPTISSPLLLPCSVLLSSFSSSPPPVSWAAAWSGDRRPRSWSFFYCFDKQREREGVDNNGRVREDEREKSSNITSRH